jgi:hypothetical protein
MDEEAAERERKNALPARRLFTGDVTTEKLAEMLSAPENEAGGMGIVKDELAGWLQGMDQYRGGKGGDRQFYLEAYVGDDTYKDRMAKGSSHYIEVSAVSVLGGIQQERLHKLYSKEVDDGFMERFLFVQLMPMPFREITDGSMVPFHNRSRMRDRFKGMINGRDSYSLSPEALAEMNEVRRRNHIMQSRKGPIASWYGKIEGHWAKIALLFHIIESPAEKVVSLRTAKLASRFMEEYAMPCAEVAFELMSAGQNSLLERAAECVLRHSDRGATEMTTRDFARSVHQLNKVPVHEIENAVSPLVGAGWLTPVPLEKGQGRQASARWKITSGLADHYRDHLIKAIELEREVKAKMKRGA